MMRTIAISLLLFVLFLFTLPAFADTAGLTWVAPVEREDNSPLLPADIGGFRIYTADGTKVGNDIDPTARAFSVPSAMMGQTVYMTTFDTDGRESAYSQPAVIPRGLANPRPPGTTVTFTVGTSRPADGITP